MVAIRFLIRVTIIYISLVKAYVRFPPTLIPNHVHVVLKTSPSSAIPIVSTPPKRVAPRVLIPDLNPTPSSRYASRDWFRCLVTWPQSRILYNIANYLLAIGGWTAALNLFFVLTKKKLVFPFFLHSIAGSALSLLLVFKTNTSYDRFWEGRKLWGSIVGACRGLSRLAYDHIDSVHHKEIATLLVVFCVALRQSLQGGRNAVELDRYLAAEDIAFLDSRVSRPNMTLRQLQSRISQWLEAKYSSNPVQATALGTEFRAFISTMSAAMGSCERIVRAPAPFLYSINTSRFLTLYLLTLPLTTIGILGWYSVPTIMAVSWCFICIQEIGHYIEDPFNTDMQMIPMVDITRGIKANVQDTLNIVLNPDDTKDPIFPSQ